MDIIKAKAILKEGQKILDENSFFINTSVLDFFTKDVWNNLPQSWQIYFDNANLSELSTFLNFSTEIFQSEVPETLLKLRNLLINHSLPRKTVNIKEKDSNFNDSSTKYNNFTENKALDNLQLYNAFCGTNSLFVQEFFRKVKMKKRHEIQLLSNAVFESVMETNVDYVIDVGAGLGHLSRTLFYIYGINVVAIEQDPMLNDTANNLDKKIKRTIQISYPDYKECSKSLIHYTYEIQASTDVNDFNNILRDAVPDKNENFTFGIVGLHPCGNLAATLLKIYKECKQCRFINLASCCYMKLTTLEETNCVSNATVGFPLSEIAKEMDINLSTTARDLACHAIESYMVKLQNTNLELLKVHCYRAVLEVLITSRYPDQIHIQTQNVKHNSNLTFSEFCKLSLKGRGIELKSEDIHSENTQNMLSQWKRVVSFYCLRLIFAPLIESIILLDRCIYLQQSKEMEYVKVKPCFDPRISPRTHVITSIKTIK